MNGKPQKKIYWSLILVFFYFSVAAGMAGYAFFLHQKRETKQEKWIQLDTILALKSKQIADWREGRKADGMVIFEDPFVASRIQMFLQNPSRVGPRKEILEWMKSLQRLQRTQSYKRIVLLDPEMTGRLSVPQGQQALDSVPKKNALEAAQQRTVILSDFYRDSISNSIRLSLFVPIVVQREGTPRTVAVVCLEIDPDQALYPMIENWPMPSRTSEAVLVRREGNEVIFLNELRLRKQTALTLHSPVSRSDLLAAKAVGGEEGIVEGVDYRGVPVLGAIGPIAESPWFLVTKVDQQEIYAPIETQARIIGAFIAGFIIIVAFAIGFVWQGHHLQEQRFFEARFHNVINRSADGILMIDEGGRILFVNPAAEKLFGRKIGSLLGETFGYPVLGGEKTEIEIFSGAKQRTVAEMRVTETEWGQQSAYLATLRDITERKQAEELLESFFTVSPDLLCIAGFDGYFKKLSQSWQETLGYSMEELLSKPWLDFVHPDDTQATIGAENQLYEGKKVIKFENRYRTKNDQYRWIEWHCTPLMEDKRIYCVARDITELKRAAEEIQRRTMELESANKELEAFSYSVSHDLRNPLLGIHGFSRILLEKHSANLDEQGGKFLHIIESSTKEMLKLIDDLLAFSVSGNQKIEPTIVDMNELARTVFEELKGIASERTVHAKFEMLPPACGDQRMIRQVLLNLISNAIKFTRPREVGTIEIASQFKGKENIYYVRDNGIGFDMESSDKLFVAFQRLSNGSEFEGTGLGLAIVQRIVDRHGGKVWAEGETGKGATFYFSLPQSPLCEGQMRNK